MGKIIKTEEQPFYVSTGRIVDEKGNYVAGTKTKEIATKLVASANLISDLINKFAND